MQMEAGLDTGPVRLVGRTPIGEYDTTGVLIHRLSLMGGELMTRVLASFDDYPAVPQADDGITYAAKIEKSEAKIDWTAGAQQVLRQVRAFNPSPGAWFEYNGERLKVIDARILSENDPAYAIDFPTEPGVVIGDHLAIGCGIGAIRPTLIQRAGRGIMETFEFLRGFPIPAGTRL
jgi:methionyl-tRNA formyltransferase